AGLYGPLVYAWCRRAGLQAADAEDVLQDVFVTVSRRIGDFRHGGEKDTFRGWLWTITRFEIGDWLRKRSRQPAGAGGSQALERLAPTPGAPRRGPGGPPGPSRRGARRGAGGGLGGVVWGGGAPADAAAELGMSRNAVYVARSRVLRRLREVLGE